MTAPVLVIGVTPAETQTLRGLYRGRLKLSFWSCTESDASLRAKAKAHVVVASTRLISHKHMQVVRQVATRVIPHSRGISSMLPLLDQLIEEEQQTC